MVIVNKLYGRKNYISMLLFACKTPTRKCAFAHKTQMFCKKMQSFSTWEHNSFVRECNCLWELSNTFIRVCKVSLGIAVVLPENAIFFQEKAIILWQNAKILRGTQMFCKKMQMISGEGNNFARECRVSRGNTIDLRENTTVLWENAIFWEKAIL